MVKVLLRAHNDLDGVSASFIMQQALRRKYRNVTIDVNYGKTVREDEIKRIAKEAKHYDLLIFLDTGAERGAAINKHLNKYLDKTWVIDHHRLFDRERPRTAVYINPEEQGKDSLYWATASTLTYQYVKEELGVKDPRLAVIATLGAYSDLADFQGSLQGLNREVAQEAIDAKMFNEVFGFTARFKDRDTISDVIDENYYPVPTANFRAVLPAEYSKKRYYNMTVRQIEQMAQELHDVYDGQYSWAFRETLYLKNRNRHYGEIHDAVSTIEELIKDKGYKEAEKALTLLIKNRAPRYAPRQRTRLAGSLIRVPRFIETPEYYIIVSDGMKVSSAKATMIATRYLTKKPVIAVARYEHMAFVTARMHPKHFKNRDLGQEMYSITKNLRHGYGGGHRIAGGGGFAATELQKFLRLLNA